MKETNSKTLNKEVASLPRLNEKVMNSSVSSEKLTN